MEGLSAALVFSAAAEGNAKAYTDQAISLLPNGLTYKGAVADYAHLPTSGQKAGDTYTTQDDGREYAWGEVGGSNTWIQLGVDAYDKTEADALFMPKPTELSQAAYDALEDKTGYYAIISD